MDPSVKHKAVERGVRSACCAEAVSLVGPRDKVVLRSCSFVFTLFFFGPDYGDIKVSGRVWEKTLGCHGDSQAGTDRGRLGKVVFRRCWLSCATSPDSVSFSGRVKFSSFVRL